mmetsp:Transcript_65383/g.108641  ORF Transcript_65383/g.108641 Transcript_65383/m.108641 type:complete len:459 (-) Transcript_65383:77-1453(-)
MALGCRGGRDDGCCRRHPELCLLQKSTRASRADHAMLHGTAVPQPSASQSTLTRTAANSTFTCCPGGSLLHSSDTFWSEPLPDIPPYRRLVERLLAPLGRISRANVLRSTWSRSTCAILRVSHGQVCKVRMDFQRRERTHHIPQENSLFWLVQDLLPLPDLEIAYCPGDGDTLVADRVAAAARWNGRTGCMQGAEYRSAALLQFRCQAKAHLPFFFWYRQGVFGNFSEWDATTASLRARAAEVHWGWRASKAFFRGSLNGAMTAHTCMHAHPRDRPTRCQLLHLSLAQPELIDYKVGPNTSLSFEQWARYKYVLFLEGTQEWADRLKLLLHLGSVVLIQELWCQEYYFWMMQPWVHYVPVSTRLEDLAATVLWLREHEEESQQIAAAGQRFAQDHLRLHNVRAFHRQLLLEYAARYDASRTDGGWPRGTCPAAAEPLHHGTIADLRAPAVQHCYRAPR